MGCLSVIFSPKTADNKLFAQRTRRRRIFHDQTIMYLNCNSFAYKKKAWMGDSLHWSPDETSGLGNKSLHTRIHVT